MKTFDNIVDDVKEEIEYQNKKFADNDKKPFEVWLLIAKQYMDDAIERYGHGTQMESRDKLLKAITSGIRGLQSESPWPEKKP